MIVDKYSTGYTFDIYVVLNPSKDELDKLFKWTKDDSSIYDENNKKYTAYSCSGVTDKCNGEECFVVIVNSIGKDEPVIVSHEVFRITMDLLKILDIQYSEYSRDVYTYFRDYIAECIYKTARKE